MRHILILILLLVLGIAAAAGGRLAYGWYRGPAHTARFNEYHGEIHENARFNASGFVTWTDASDPVTSVRIFIRSSVSARVLDEVTLQIDPLAPRQRYDWSIELNPGGIKDPDDTLANEVYVVADASPGGHDEYTTTLIATTSSQ